MQHLMDFPVIFPRDAYEYGTRSDGGRHGLVLTKPHVVDLILDLAGYAPGHDLARKRILEPSCGHGAFLIPAVQRLLLSAREQEVPASDLSGAVSAFDIDPEHVRVSRNAVAELLTRHEVKPTLARELAEEWVQEADFLLTPIRDDIHFIVGNPPYIRIEQLSPEIQAEYRRRYTTLFDRADLYVAFIERSLRLLAPGGALAFICADRWTLNKYGAPLRQVVSSGFSVRCYVDLHRSSPFESEVIAYPSIFVIGREPPEAPVRVITMKDAAPDECLAAASVFRGEKGGESSVDSATYSTWFSGDEPWVLSSPNQLATLRGLEKRFPLLEESGATSVRIGIATGNDGVYIVPEGTDIEPDRLVPLVMRADIQNGKVNDARRFVINTYADKGTIDLESYPRLKKYLDANADILRRRHVAQKTTSGWFRTIDRPHPHLVERPKLLIPDIAGSNEVVYEEGRYYPHHNLYFIISDEWDMEVLGGLLSSRVALFFVWSYAVKMRGGYLRFQAQYLRRIRVPHPQDISARSRNSIRSAFRKRDFAKLDELSRQVYGLKTLPEFDFVDTRR